MDSFHGLKLLEFCGSGAYGDVYYCEDISGKKMAVKIVSKKKIGEHWKREFRGIVNYRKITDENNSLLKIFHVSEDDECFYYTMEAADSFDSQKYIPDTLALRLQQEPLAAEDLTPILSSIFDGVKAIHNAGFAHRDIKPDNILFVNGKPKLADIGLLSSLSVTVTQFAGTLDFLPPEERSSETPDLTNRQSRQRNDLYAFGKVIYCAVTGNSPEMFPHIPKDFNLSIQRKYYLHLAFQLCDREPLCRLNSIEKTELALAGIQRKLEYGITGKDLFCDTAKKLKYRALRALAASWKMTRLYWYFIIPLLLLTGTGAYFLFRPKPPFDLANVKTKDFSSAYANLSMTIPAQWEVVPTPIIKNLLKNIKPDNEQDKKLFAQMETSIKNGADFIFCDLRKNSHANVTVEIFPIPGAKLQNISDTELRLEIKKLFQGHMNFNTEIYEIKRTFFAGTPCITVYLSHDTETRGYNYVFLQKHRCISISLFSHRLAFREKLAVFKAVLKTLKFHK